MIVCEFDLILAGLDIEADVARLDAFEQRVHDITFAAHGTVVRAAVERKAESLGDAIRVAICDVESIPGVCVLRVEPEDLVSQAQIALRAGRSRQSVSQWVAGTRGPGGFPPPAFESGSVALWRWSEVLRWMRTAGYVADGSDDQVSAVIGAANALLEARRAVAHLDEAERASLKALVA
jgi:hypothetical protein